MSVVMHDSISQLNPEDRTLLSKQELGVVLYADDTLLIGSEQGSMSRLLAIIAANGAKCGMQLHWDKFQLLNVRCNFEISKPGGELIQPNSQLSYLGTTLAEDGRIESEVARRLGAAWASFIKFDRLWKHTYLSSKRKLQIFQAVVAPKLLYSLTTVWLSAAQRRRIDGFQARCLRRILRVPVAFVSRVSNAAVLEKAAQVTFSSQLLRHQLYYFGNVARAPDVDPRRAATFVPGTLEPRNGRFIRRIGRPRSEWGSMLLKEANKASGRECLDTAVLDEASWKHKVLQLLRPESVI